jgi:hypothetical protein
MIYKKITIVSTTKLHRDQASAESDMKPLA